MSETVIYLLSPVHAPQELRNAAQGEAGSPKSSLYGGIVPEQLLFPLLGTNIWESGNKGCNGALRIIG